MDSAPAIPPVRPRAHVEDIRIRESHDDVVTVEPGDGIHVAPAYHARGIPGGPDRIRLRAGVLARLRQATAALPAGTDLLIWDGLRSLETQAEIVASFRASLPEAGRDEVVERYLALPPESEAEFRTMPPPHSTGGAVDLTLCDTGGEPLDLGADFDEFDDVSWLRHYEDDPGPAGQVFRDRRRLLYWAMTGAGFSPYPWEFWHYEWGTPVARAYYGNPVADYGPAVPWPGTPIRAG